METVKNKFRSLSGSPRELWLVCLLTFIESYAYFSMSMILTLYLSREFGMSDMQAGTVYGMYGALCTFFGFCIGFLIDSLGVRVSLVLAFSCSLCARLLMAVTTDEWTLKLCLYALMPLGSALGMPVMSMGIKRYTNSTNRGFAFGIFYAVMNVSALLGGIVVDAFEIGMKDGETIFGYEFTSKRLILLSGAAVTLVGLLVSLCFREIKVSDGEDVGVESHTVEWVSPITIAKELLGMKTFWKYMAITLICVNLKCIFRYMDALLPKYLVREFGDDVPKGTINSINPAIIIFLVPVVSAFTSNTPAYSMIHFGSYITALSLLPLCFVSSIGSTVLFVVFLSFGEALWSPRFYDLTVSMAPEGREGTFVAMGSAPLFLAKLPVGILSGYLLQEYCPKEGPRSPTTMWWVLFLITIPAPLLLSLFSSCLSTAGQESSTRRAKHPPLYSKSTQGRFDPADCLVGSPDSIELPLAGNVNSSVD